jgi:lipoprotein-anchoring transpeptidase ErfK/SrfK
VPAHGRGPVPPADVSGEPVPAYPPGYAQPAPPPYPPPSGRGYYGYPDQTAEYPDQTAERPGPADTPRPPNAVGGAPEATGSLNPPAPGTVRPNGATVVAGLPPEDQPESSAAELPPQLHKQLVDYTTSEPAGTIVIDTPHTFLYLVLGRGKALRYGVGVGREGFTWSGVERIKHMSEWPDWHPPKEMIERQPYLPRFMAGGEGNPLGARALYLGNTVYRIHGTNQPANQPGHRRPLRPRQCRDARGRGGRLAPHVGFRTRRRHALNFQSQQRRAHPRGNPEPTRRFSRQR